VLRLTFPLFLRLSFRNLALVKGTLNRSLTNNKLEFTPEVIMKRLITPVRMIGLSGLLLVVSLPVRAVESRYAFGLTLSQYASMSASNTANGYRPISIDANGPTNSPDIAAIWIADGFTNWTTVLGATSVEYSNQVVLLSGQGYRTLCVDAYGDYPNERYVAVWVKDAQVATGWAQVFNLSEADYNTAWNNYLNSGYRPVWISVLANNSTPRFSGVWVKDGVGFWTYWNMTAGGLGQTVTNILGQGGRPISLTGYSPPGTTLFAAHWIYAEQPVWTWNSELTAAAFQGAAANLSSNGFRPVCITEYGVPASPRYASVWVHDPPPVWTITGVSDPSLAALDNELTNYMSLRNIERGTLAVTRNGKLVFHHAYTLAPTNAIPTQTTNLFRIASLTKQFTSVAIMQLLQVGKLGLDQSISNYLDLSTVSDARFRTVTIRQLLQHYGGWDRTVSYDPMFRDAIISSTLGRPLPTTPQMVIDYMKGQPLDHDPGTVYAYSNFGYCLLGRIIEAVTGMTYEQFIQANVLAPAGIWDMRLGKSLQADADPAEVDYEDPLRRIVPTVMGTNGPGMVPIQYGGWNIATMDSHGGWLATAADLVRFSSSFDVQTSSPLLPLQWIDTMWSQPPEITGPPPSYYYGAGWLVRPLGGDTYNAWHDGSLVGTFSYTVRRADGYCWAVIFNRRDDVGDVPNYYNIDAEMNNAINTIANWPTNDLFDANGDGLLDAWQIHYFGSTSSPAAAPSADPDGDGANNLNEFVNLTDPTDSTSVKTLKVNADPQNGQNLMLSWFAARGRVYSVETTASLSSPNWQALASATDNVGDNSMRLITNFVSGTGFYRLRARLQRP
jgi:CubicO group peptidase (beta-lactamase class C family)